MAGDLFDIGSLARGFAVNARQVQTDVEKIIEKYDREFPDDDVLELTSLCIFKDRGKLRHLKPRRVGCTKSSKSRHRQDYSSSESSLAESIQDTEIKTEPKDLVDISVISESCIRWAEMSDEPSDAETISSESGSENWEIDECSISSSSEQSSLEVISFKSDEESAEENTSKWLTLEPRKAQLKAAEKNSQPNRNILSCIPSHSGSQLQNFPSRSDSSVQHSSPPTRDAYSTDPSLLSISAFGREVREIRRLSARQEERRVTASLKRIVPVQLFPEKIQQKNEGRKKEEENDVSLLREPSLLQFVKLLQVSNPVSAHPKVGESYLNHQHSCPSPSNISGQLLPGKDQLEKSSREKEKCLKHQCPSPSPTKRSGSVQFLPGKDQLEKTSKEKDECLKQQYLCPSPSKRTGFVQFPPGNVQLETASKEKKESHPTSWCQSSCQSLLRYLQDGSSHHVNGVSEDDQRQCSGKDCKKDESIGTKNRGMPIRNGSRQWTQPIGNFSRPSVIKSILSMKNEDYHELVNSPVSSHPCHMEQVLFTNKAFGADSGSERKLSQDIIEEKLTSLYISEGVKCTSIGMNVGDLSSQHTPGLHGKARLEDFKAGPTTPLNLQFSILKPDSSVKSLRSANATRKSSLPATKTESPSLLAQARQRFIPAPFPPMTTEEVLRLFSISDMNAFVELCVESSCKKTENMSHLPRPINLKHTPEKRIDDLKMELCPPTKSCLHNEALEKLFNCHRFLNNKRSGQAQGPSRDASSVDSGFYSPVSFSKRPQQLQTCLTHLPKKTALECTPEKEMVCSKSVPCTEKKSMVCQEKLTISTNSCKRVQENFPVQMKQPSGDVTYVCLERDKPLSFTKKWKQYQCLEKEESLCRTSNSTPYHCLFQTNPSSPHSHENNKASELDLVNSNTSQDLTTYCTKVLDRLTLSNPCSPRKDNRVASQLPLSTSASPNATFSVSPSLKHSLERLHGKRSGKDIHQAFMHLKLPSIERQKNREGAVPKEAKLCSKYYEQTPENRHGFVQRNSVTNDGEAIKKGLVTNSASSCNRKSFTDLVKHRSTFVAWPDSSHVSKATVIQGCKEVLTLSTDTTRMLNGTAEPLSRPRVLRKWKNISSCNLNDTVVGAKVHNTSPVMSGPPGHLRTKMVHISSPHKSYRQPDHLLSSETFCVSPSSRKRRIDSIASQSDFTGSVSREGRKSELVTCKRQRTRGTFLTSTPAKSASQELGKGFSIDDTLSTISGEGSDLHITVTSGDCSDSDSNEGDTVILVN